VEFEISEKLLLREKDFNFSSSDTPLNRQAKMKLEIRKAVIGAGLKGVLELMKHPKYGFEFREAIQKKIWFQGVIQRKEWFENIFKDQEWYKKATADKELLDCNHLHDKSSFDGSVREECLALRNLYALLYGMFKHNIDTNGQPRQPRPELPKNQKQLYQVIGNKRFSPTDDIQEMQNEEFCKRAASSTLAELIGNKPQFFETYVRNLYESGSNSYTNEKTLDDSEKREMLITGKGYIMKRIYNPEKFERDKRGNQP